MSPKIKELVRDLEMAGFVNRGGKRIGNSKPQPPANLKR